MCDNCYLKKSQSRSRSLGTLNHFSSKKRMKLYLFNDNNNYYEINYETFGVRVVKDFYFSFTSLSLFFQYLSFRLGEDFLQSFYCVLKSNRKLFSLLTFGLLLSCCGFSGSFFLLRVGTRPGNSCMFSLNDM